MQNKFTKFLFSTRLTAVLFITFAAAMAIGTFMDAGQETSPTPYTRNLIYNTWWFEAILFIFMINFIGNIPKYRLWRKDQWATLMLHLSFILIIIGAGITRYISYEGMMNIREGETENAILSHKTYITAYIDGDYMVNGQAQRKIVEEEVDFSHRLKNKFHYKTHYNNQDVTFELEKFIGGAEKDVVPDENGKDYLKIVESGDGAPHNHFLESGEVQSIHNVLFSLNKEVEGAVNITSSEKGITIYSPFEGEYMTMASGVTGQLVKDSLQPLILRSLYKIGGMQMVFPNPVVKGNFDIVKKSEMLLNDEDGLVLKVTSNGETEYVKLLGGQGYSKPFEKIEIAGLDIAVKYGSKIIELPFSIKLNEFIADKYPGTEKSYSSFASEVTVIDEKQENYNYRIFMNNILDHGGYRFFQAGFDPDEKGTNLSVNHDFYGTWITYIGYFFLYFGMIAILFDSRTRFGDLKRQLKRIKHRKSKALMVLFLFAGLQGFSQDNDHSHSSITPSKAQIDSILKANITPKAHADKFAHLVIQDASGRMMPINTYASEMLRKLSKNDTYEDFDANQIFLSIQESPLLWYNVPIIYLKPQKGDSIRRLIGVPEGQKFVSLVNFFTENGDYKLAPYLEEAYKAQIPNGFQKEFKETDQRVNLLYNTIEGYALRIFPIPDDYNNKWISSIEYRRDNYREQIKDSLYANFVNNGFSAYLLTLNSAKQSGDFSKAEDLLESFKKTQHKFGSEVMLSDQ
ncbi:MAG: cytochrome c biogenesis protein ResB, partial [Xanthomarina sp.]